MQSCNNVKPLVVNCISYYDTNVTDKLTTVYAVLAAVVTSRRRIGSRAVKRASDSTCSTAARVTSFRHSFIHPFKL